ncbi:MAG: hypothetical protein JWP74_3897 [Marmoricola sp.]|nr:hypothetical protein [Marmoricola sp.]
MRARIALVVVLVAVLSACGSSSSSDTKKADSTPTSGTTSVPGGSSLDCAKFANTAEQMSAAAQKAFTGSADSLTAGLKALDAEFNALKQGAPADVKSAIDDLTSAFSQIAKIRANPTAANASNLQKLSARLPTDDQKIAAYITTKCN